MGKIEVTKGDITKMNVGAIVNAANAELRGGGGVDGAIHRAGGPEIMEACRKIGGCPTGKAVITTAGKLLSKYVIHTVGPVWQGGRAGERELLAKAYISSMELALKHEVHSIAFPNISTGVYAFPKDQAAAIAIETIRHFLMSGPYDIDVYFACFDDENYELYRELLD